MSSFLIEKLKIRQLNTNMTYNKNVRTDIVKNRFQKLDSGHIRYVLDGLDRTTTAIGNIRAYILSALFNAPTTISQYYASLVRHDMANGSGSG